MRTSFAALTDVGLVRKNNEDSYVVFDASSGTRHSPPPAMSEGTVDTDGKGLLIAVADGMGGALAGEVASGMAIDALCEAAKELDESMDHDAAKQLILTAIGRANQRIHDASINNPEQRGMGTTLTAALVRQGRIQYFQVGDSKGFLGKNGQLFQMTADHSLIGTLVADKVISPEDAEQLEGGRNIILKALGAEPKVGIDCNYDVLKEGQVVLLCSDGLCITNDEIEAIVGGTSDPGKLCDDLVREANARGGNDNITVVCVSILESDDSPRMPGIIGRIAGMFRRKK